MEKTDLYIITNNKFFDASDFSGSPVKAKSQISF